MKKILIILFIAALSVSFPYAIGHRTGYPPDALASQNSTTIANGTGAQVRTAINNALDTLKSSSSGTVAPSAPTTWQVWKDTTTGDLKQYNGSAWEVLSGPGLVSMWSGTVIPTGWLACDGSCVSRTTYSHLFLKTSTTYSTCDGSTTFGLPNFTGIFPKGVGTSQVISGTTYTGATIGAATRDSLQGHYHSPLSPQTTFIGEGGSPDAAVGSGATNWRTAGTTGAMVTDGTNSTPRSGYVTEPANIGIYFIIKY